MANCVYSLHGRIFNSELELDNFLLNNKNSIARGDVSDIVFSKRHTQSEVLAILKEKLVEAERILELKKVRANKGTLTFEEEELVAPYMAATKFLTQPITKNNNRIVPEYIEDNLRLKLYERWQSSGVSEAHALLLGIPSGVPITSLDEKNRIWNLLKDAWTKLGTAGTAIHRVLEQLWLNDLPSEPTLTEQEILLLPEVNGVIDNDVLLSLITIKQAIKNHLVSMNPRLFDNAIFIPEYPIIADTTAVSNNGSQIKVLGIIDLLVIDNDGNVHIFDYKTSDKDVDSWSSAKKWGFKNQLGLYKGAIDSYGINTYGTDIGIIPLMMEGDNLRNGVVSKVVMHPTERIINYRGELHPASTIMLNMRSIIVDKSEQPKISNDFINKILTLLLAIFPSYKFLEEFNEAVMRSLAAEAKFNPNTGKYELPDLFDRSAKVEFDESDLEEVLKRYHLDLLTRDADSFRYYLSLIRRAMQESDPSILSLEESKAHLGKNAVSRDWFMNQFALFCTGNGEWEMLDVPEFETLGIIVMHNVVGGYYKVYIIDSQDPNTQVPLKYGKSVLGSFSDDILPELNGITPLVCDIGNINNIKAMLALNAFPEIIKDGEEIEGIYPICPRKQLGHHANSKLLIDNFTWLADRAKISNNFANGNLKFLNSINVAYQIIRECASMENSSKSMNRILSKFENSGLFLQETLANLMDAKKALEDEYPDFTNMEGGKGPKIDLTTPQGRAYARIMLGIAEILNGFYTQQLRDGSGIKHLIDNPEVLEHNLRNIYKLTTNYYEAYKRDMNREAAEFREMQLELWKAKGYSLALRNTLNNERELYKNMFEDNPDRSGRFRFKDPWDPNSKLDDAERKFLKKALVKLALLRNPKRSAAEAELDRNDPENTGFFDVPLLRQKGSKNPFTRNGRKGLISWFKRSIDYIKNFRGNIRKGVTEALTPKDSELAEQNAELFKAFDLFESSENPTKREELLKENDLDIYDHDLGNILYMYAGAKIRKNLLDEYLPLLKAQLVQNMYEAATNNIAIDNNIDYILKYTKAKIMDMSIVPENYRALAKALEKVRAVTTYMSLGFSPKAGLFQMMEGVWKNASRAGFKPLGPNLFGIDELRTACNWLIGDTPDHFKVVSLGELINEWYAINDMDVSSFAKRLHDGLYPLTFTGKAMWLTSAPDYFNRMSIFIALMIKDGCFEAHELDGLKMKYDWKKDKRFSAFANGDRSDMVKYNLLKALYHTMMAQFLKEGYQVLDENGMKRDLYFDPTSDVPQDALPQAYTNQDARNIKSFADQLYGYYNHEDLFLLKSMLLGALFTLFRTFWSSLKNRWFLKGGIYSNGHWELAVNEEGEPMFKKFNVDEDGNLLSVELTTEDTGEAYMIWKGSYQEGFWLTLKESALALFNPEDDRPLKERAISIVHGESGTDNEDVIKIRATNLKLIAHDLLLWTIIGLLIGSLLTKYLKEQAKADKSRRLSFGDMTLRSAEDIFVSSLVSSTEDLGALRDLASPLTDWTPPSFRFMKNLWDDGYNWLNGDKSFTKALTENISVMRQTKNYWYKAEKMAEEM